MKAATVVCLLFYALNSSVYSQSYITQVKSSHNAKWGYVSDKGIIVEPQFSHCYEFGEDGLAAIRDGRSYYFINVKGDRLVTTVRIDDVGGPFHNGLAPVRVGDYWGYLDTTGKLAVPAKFAGVQTFYEGYAVALRQNDYFIVDKEGMETQVDIHDIYVLNHFSEGLASFENMSRKMGFIDVHGAVVIPAVYKDVGYFKHGLAWVRTGDGLGYIDPKGEWRIKPGYSLVNDFDPDSGCARVRDNNGSWYFVNTAGEKLSVSADVVGDFSNGLCAGRKDDLWGFFDDKGKWVIPTRYDDTRKFKNGFVAVKTKGLWGIVNKNGDWIVKPVYAGIRDMEFVNR